MAIRPVIIALTAAPGDVETLSLFGGLVFKLNIKVDISGYFTGLTEVNKGS